MKLFGGQIAPRHPAGRGPRKTRAAQQTFLRLVEVALQQIHVGHADPIGAKVFINPDSLLVGLDRFRQTLPQTQDHALDVSMLRATRNLLQRSTDQFNSLIEARLFAVLIESKLLDRNKVDEGPVVFRVEGKNLFDLGLSLRDVAASQLLRAQVDELVDALRSLPSNTPRIPNRAYGR